MKKVTLFFGILTMLIFSEKGIAQSLLCTAIPSIGGTAVAPPENYHSMVRDNLGNFFQIGTVTNSGTGTDIVISKLSQSCSVLWTKTWNNILFNLNDEPIDLCADMSGNVYITGYTTVGTNNRDVVTLKYNSSGALVWTSTYAGSGNYLDEGYSISTNGTSVCVAGYTSSNTTTFSGLVISYAASNGSPTWATPTFISLTSFVVSYGVCMDVSGNIYVASQVKFGSNNSSSEIRLSKFNGSTGAFVWDVGKRLTQPGTGYNNLPNKIVCDIDGVIVGGVGFNSSNGTNDYFIFKYNFNGGHVWTSSYDWGSRPQILNDIVVDITFSKVFVTGYSSITGQGTNSADVTTVGLSSINGSQLWAVNYNSSANKADMGEELDLDCTGALYVAAKSFSTAYRYLLIKYNPASGAMVYEAFYNPTAANSIPSDIVVGTNGVYLSGVAGTPQKLHVQSFSGVASQFDCVGTRLSGITEQVEHSTTSIYPNPSTGIFHLTSDQSGTAKVYDLQGKLFKSFEVHENENDFDLSMFDNGIYFLVLTDANGEGISKQRIVINK